VHCLRNSVQAFFEEDTQRTCTVTLRRVRETVVAVEKPVSIPQSECVCVCARARVCVCSLSYPACKAHAPYCTVTCDLSGSTIFFHIINGTTIGKKLLNKKCVFTCTIIGQAFRILIKRIHIYVIINVYRSSCKVLVILVRFNQTFQNFLEWFSKNTRTSDLMKIRVVEAKLFYADGQTDITKLSRFSQFCAKAYKITNEAWV
jgi:hypothetical protein